MSNNTEDRIRSFGNLFFGISVVLAIILTICGLFVAYNTALVGGWYYSELDMGVYSSVLLTFIIVAAVILLIGFFIKCILDVFAGIHENTRRTAELLSNTKTDSNVYSNVKTEYGVTAGSAKISVPKLDEWRCNNCNKINKNHITTCTCGQEKSKNWIP